jgi:two-component system phosphate regulon sensor histidine kinase PhoR
VRRKSKGPSKLLWKLFAGYALVMVLALATSAVLIVHELEKFQAQELTEHLRAQGITLRSQVRGRLEAANMAEINAIAQEVGSHKATGFRVTIAAADGTVLGDSQGDVAHMDSHHNREEIKRALEHGWGASTRWSNTVNRKLHYVAVRVGSKEAPEGVVRVGLATKTIVERAQSVRRVIWTIAAVTMVATVLFALALARLWALPIRRITRTAARLSRGDLNARATVSGNDELAHLARSLNEMGDHLCKQLSTIDGQRQTLVDLLNQLEEGVVVAAPDGRIILSNPAAARLLHRSAGNGAAAESWDGRLVEECVPQHDLQRLLKGESLASQDLPVPAGKATPVAKYHQSGSATEVRLEIPSDGGSIVVLARGSDIEIPSRMLTGDVEGETDVSLTGRILALTDITEIVRTIQMKTDFVANASHELRTPLSAIRAAIETVMNIDVTDDAKSAKRFLRVIDRHSTRLESLVADLLALSRLESPSRETKSSPISLPRVCDELSEKWALRVHEKRLEWKCNAPPALHEIVTDKDLLKMVLDNLVENAIKFTDAGGFVHVSFDVSEDDVVVTVSDNGRGIPPQEQERVFERFYQVAQDRSGEGQEAERRGTGLGLAIVRHAVASMGGKVHLSSRLGAGTEVTFTIPQPA